MVSGLGRGGSLRLRAVEMTPHRFCCRAGNDRRQGIDLRLPDGADGAEGLFQFVPPLGAHAGNPVQGGTQRALFVALVVIGDGKAVGLLLNPANEGKDGLLGDDADLPALRRH